MAKAAMTAQNATTELSCRDFIADFSFIAHAPGEDAQRSSS